MSVINQRNPVKKSEIKMVQLIVHPGNTGWILEKIANRLKENFESMGVSAQILDSPHGAPDVVFYLHFGHQGIIGSNVDKYSARLKSAFVTHVDDSAKVKLISNLQIAGVDLVFMSPAHSLEISSMLGFPKSFFNILLGTDLVNTKRRMKIGIFSKCFPDGRKNEKWLIEFAKKNSLEDCEFIFIGVGWERIRDRLEAAGAQVKLYDGIQYPYPEYSDFPRFYKDLDLYIYPGFDEGAMGALDAYVLGVHLLISNQGFHKEFEIEDSSFFSNYEEFSLNLKSALQKYRDHQKALEVWTWTNTAATLMNHWSETLEASGGLMSVDQKEGRSALLTKLNSKNRKKYFIFIRRRSSRFVKIRLRNRIIRIFKSFFRL